MSEIVIKSVSTGATLAFSQVETDCFTVIFSSASLSASHRVWVYTGDYEQLVDLFLEMAANWTGWEGAKTWSVIEGDFSLSCTSDKLGHITLEVDLLGRDVPESWFARFSIEIEAGQLEKIAGNVKKLFGGR